MVSAVAAVAASGVYVRVSAVKAAGSVGGEKTNNNAQAAAEGQSASSGSSNPTDTVQLSPEAQAEVTRLQQVDAQVRQHEAAHQAGGAAAGGASFEYQRGPDGKNYAVGGEVPVDISGGSTPDATIAKMEQVKAAALAPADPSGQDRSVAAQADAIKLQAQLEKSKEGDKSGGAPSGTPDTNRAGALGTDAGRGDSLASPDQAGSETASAASSAGAGRGAIGGGSFARRASSAYGAASLLGTINASTFALSA